MLDQIQSARRAHERLRSLRAAADAQDKNVLHREVKGALEDVWSTAGGTAGGDNAAEVRQIVARLVADAEYYAGLSDAEGFRDAGEVMEQYDRLARAFGDQAQ